MALMGYREYARHRGCALRAVQKAIADGRIQTVTDAQGKAKIDAAAADAAWTANTDPAKQSLLYSAPLAGAAPATRQKSAPADDEEEAGAADDTAAYRAARAEREQLRVERERLDLDRERGALVSADDAQRAVFTAFRALRDNLLMIGARVKHDLAALTDAEACERLLDQELSAVLAAFRVESALSDGDEDDEEEGG